MFYDKEKMKKLDLEFDKFMQNATDLEIYCYNRYLPMTEKLRLRIIDRMEELECDTLLEQFLIDLRDSSKYHIV